MTFGETKALAAPESLESWDSFDGSFSRETLWIFAFSNGLGLRSWPERGERRQRPCFWKMRVMNVSCR